MQLATRPRSRAGTRRALVLLVATSAVALGVGTAPGAGSAPAPSAGVVGTGAHPSGASGVRAYHRLARKPTADYVRLDLLALNDFHGNLEVTPATSSNGRINNTPAGGAAFLASLVKRERKESRANGATPLVVAAGDLIGGSPLLSAAFHDEPTIKAMNKLKLAVSAVGNHEFDEGVGELLRMQHGGCLNDGAAGANGANSCPGTTSFKGADFKYLGANVTWKDPSSHPRATPFKPYKIEKVAGQKVAFIGMTLEGTPLIVAQAGIASVDFRDEVETANALVPKLRKKGVKSIIVLLHEGVTPTDATAYNSCTGVSGTALDIAKALAPQIDAVISGHTHQPYNCVVDDPRGRPRLLTSASSFGRMITKIHLLIDPKTRDIVRPAAYAENLVVANSEGQRQSTKINKLIAEYKTLVASIENAVVGHVGGSAPSVSNSLDADGSKDSALGNLIADAQRADPTIVSAGRAPQIALMNPGGIRADLAVDAARAVTYGAAFRVQPFNNFMVSMDLTGAQVKAVLSEGFNGFNEAAPAGSGTNKVLQVSGLSYTWDVSDAAVANAPAVTNVLVDDDRNEATSPVPIVDSQVYRVVVNNFLSDGGDGFATFRLGTNKLVGGLDIDSLRLYLQTHDPYIATATTRITSQL